MSGSRRGPSPVEERVRGLSMRSADGGRRTTRAALSAYAGGGGGGEGARGARAAKTGTAAVMRASTTPETRIPRKGRGEARADPGREGGRETCVDASTRTIAFEAISGSSASRKNSSVSSRSSDASSTNTACGGGCGCAGALTNSSGVGASKNTEARRYGGDE